MPCVLLCKLLQSRWVRICVTITVCSMIGWWNVTYPWVSDESETKESVFMPLSSPPVKVLSISTITAMPETILMQYSCFLPSVSFNFSLFWTFGFKVCGPSSLSLKELVWKYKVLIEILYRTRQRISRLWGGLNRLYWFLYWTVSNTFLWNFVTLCCVCIYIGLISCSVR